MASNEQAGYDMAKEAAKALSFHFDSVQIVCTLHKPSNRDPDHESTSIITYGIGNSFARIAAMEHHLRYVKNCHDAGCQYQDLDREDDDDAETVAPEE